MAYSYECKRDGDKCIQRLFGYIRRTAASPRSVDSPSMTLAQLVRARRGHNLPRQAASFEIHQTDTGPAFLSAVSGTPKNGNGYRPQNGVSPAMVMRCIRRRLPG